MKRLETIKGSVILLMFIITISLFYIQIIKNDYYIELKKNMTEKIVEGDTAPRGRIYDRNGNLLVDNKPVKVIYYKKDSKVDKKEELNIVKELSRLIEVDYKKITKRIKQDYFLIINPDLKLITNEEFKLYKDRKITYKELMNIKYSKITDEYLNDINEEEAYIYYLMNNGYSYEQKIIKNSDVTDYEYAIIAENLEKLPGVGIRLDWERVYLYGNVFRTIFGNVGSIPYEQKEYYMNNGYSNDDIVGISYLEYQYDEYLKGVKNKYLVKNNDDYSLINEGSKGSDLYLTIDINLQKEIENIIINNLKNSKYELNTRHLNKSFVIVSNPKTGEILAMAGKQITNNNVYDYTPGIITTSYVVGSTVKGASHIVGYNNGALKIGEVRDDSCIKVKATKEKCSWKYLGNINDITALKYSSNTYQFRTAINVGGGRYSYNSSLSLNDESFDIYRKTFNEFGLGVKTEIDLPNEKLGYKGVTKNANLLLNFSIGQYDTYTPIQLAQYINTIANNGVRLKPRLLSRVVSNENEIVFEAKEEILNNVQTEEVYLNRVKEGFKEVMNLYGTGYNYINPIYLPAGKTGTSQSFLDTDNNGVIDIQTVSTTFVGYAPYNDPIFSIAVITPDVSDYSSGSYVSYITRSIVRQTSDFFFQYIKLI